MNEYRPVVFASLVTHFDFKTYCLLHSITNQFNKIPMFVVQDKPYLSRPKPLYLETLDTLQEVAKSELINFARQFSSNVEDAVNKYPPFIKILLIFYLAKQTKFEYCLMSDNDIVIRQELHEIRSLIESRTPFLIPEAGGSDFLPELFELYELTFRRKPNRLLPRIGQGFNIGFSGIDLNQFKLDEVVISSLLSSLITKILQPNNVWTLEQAFFVMMMNSCQDNFRRPVDLGPFGYYFSRFDDPIYFNESKIYHCIFTKNKSYCNFILSQAYPSLNARRYQVLLAYLRSNPVNSILEVGVWRGDTARMMILNCLNEDIEYTGLDLFEGQTAIDYISEVSLSNPLPVADVYDRLRPYCDNVRLLKGYSKDTLTILEREERRFDLIFLDGGHSYPTVKGDFEICKKLLSDNGIIFIDDYTQEPSLAGLRQFILEIAQDPQLSVVNYDEPSDEYRGYKYSIVSVTTKKSS
jgi:predicted O-methyltransferase YrrM